jgi:hypothetical protein
MAPGTIVVYPEDILLYGKMIILEVVADGRLLCEQLHADRRGEHARELFAPHELETFDRWNAAQVAA